MTDQDRISPYNIKAISNRQVVSIKEKYKQGNYYLIQYQILWTNIIRNVKSTVRRITNEILEVEDLKCLVQDKIYLV